jgi:hypothetical protein
VAAPFGFQIWVFMGHRPTVTRSCRCLCAFSLRRFRLLVSTVIARSAEEPDQGLCSAADVAFRLAAAVEGVAMREEGRTLAQTGARRRGAKLGTVA